MYEKDFFFKVVRIDNKKSYIKCFIKFPTNAFSNHYFHFQNESFTHYYLCMLHTLLFIILYSVNARTGNWDSG